MTMHRMHPDPDRGDDPDAILWDDCARCEQQAAQPIASLDDDHLRALWERVRSVELGTDADHYRSRNERRAADTMYDVYLLASRASGLLSSIDAVARQRLQYRTCDDCERAIPRKVWAAHVLSPAHLHSQERRTPLTDAIAEAQS